MDGWTDGVDGREGGVKAGTAVHRVEGSRKSWPKREASPLRRPSLSHTSPGPCWAKFSVPEKFP
jgi:hypothetical protein